MCSQVEVDTQAVGDKRAGVEGCMMKEQVLGKPQLEAGYTF